MSNVTRDSHIPYFHSRTLYWYMYHALTGRLSAKPIEQKVCEVFCYWAAEGREMMSDPR